MLDKTREFATVHGGTSTTKYIQDGNRYSAGEKYLGKVDEDDRPVKPTVSNTGTIAKDLTLMGKAELITAATSHGLHANGRMSEETLRSKLNSYYGDLS